MEYTQTNSRISTKEMSLYKYKDGRYNLDICAYGEWWDEDFNNKEELLKELKETWGYRQENIDHLFKNMRLEE